MKFKEIKIEFLKDMAIAVFDRINPLLGATKGAKVFQNGAGGDISMLIDIEAENVIIDFLEKCYLKVKRYI